MIGKIISPKFCCFSLFQNLLSTRWTLLYCIKKRRRKIHAIQYTRKYVHCICYLHWFFYYTGCSEKKGHSLFEGDLWQDLMDILYRIQLIGGWCRNRSPWAQENSVPPYRSGTLALLVCLSLSLTPFLSITLFLSVEENSVSPYRSGTLALLVCLSLSLSLSHHFSLSHSFSP